ncbi:MAG: putative bifunctional diguanylate cyclase/phosphodiesterase [Pseudonocardiaceae bacterium]
MTVSPPAEPGLTVAGLAQAWAAVASRTTYLPMSGDEIEQFLTRLINRLVAAVAGARVDEQAAIEVAAELVAHGLTGSRSIGRSIEILSDGLPRLAGLRHIDGRDAAVSRVLGALAGGYAEELRQRTLEEQHQVTQALLQAKLDTERELWISETRFRQVFSESAVGIAISDLGGMLVTVNRAFAHIVGRAPADLIDAALLELLHCADDPKLGEAYRELARGELTRFRRRGQLTTASGDVVSVFLAGFLLRDLEGVPTHHVITVEDITELHLLQQELSTQALHDRLTGLPNEHYFMSRLGDVLEGADPSSMITVCRVNLDNFSVINDGIGPGAGEFLLCSVAARLQELVAGKRAMVARLGNDDFAILIENGMDVHDLSVFASSINIRCCEPIYFDNRGIAVSAGVGVARERASATSQRELLRAANITLHRAKRIGRGQWDLYDADYDAHQRERYQLAAEIPGAWESGEIGVRYQPVCRLDDGSIVALHAVLHWDRADGTMLGHSDCLALAEQTGLVVPLGRWIVEQASVAHLQISTYQPETAPQLRVDLTAQLSQDPDLVEVVRGALSATGLRPEQLWIGVPLTALASGRGDVLDNVGTLAQLGADVVLLGAQGDYGSLAYLEDLPVRAVQLAPDIVARITRAGDSSVVARAVRVGVPLVRGAGVTVIVPGVDTPEQARWWRDVGADIASGAHFGPPIPDVELPTLLGHC